MKKRTDIDFSKHEVIITKLDNVVEPCVIHYLKLPDTRMNSIKFINCGGVLSVTGDYGNWIFCREFHPSEKEYVSGSYWEEKLRIASCQDPYEYDEDATVAEINRLLAEE